MENINLENLKYELESFFTNSKNQESLGQSLGINNAKKTNKKLNLNSFDTIDNAGDTISAAGDTIDNAGDTIDNAGEL